MTEEKDNIFLSLQDICVSFGDNEVLKHVSLDVTKGEVVVVIGPSGSGKSTLLRTINMLQPVTHGKIIFDGKNILSDDVDVNKVRQRIGMVFQHYNLFPHLTVVQNLTLVPRRVLKEDIKRAEERAIQILKKVGLPDKVNKYPDQLSGGQQQRVAIARALMMQPQIMLFDEVTSALDPQLVREVLSAMKDLARSGMTMLIVTHEMGFAQEVGDTLVFMTDGTIIEKDKPANIFHNAKHERTREFLMHRLS